jgi:hypothetical protein
MRAYRGLFGIAFSTLALQITLVRLLSVTTWYHLAFFAISTAMLGMTAGAVRVYLRPRDFDPGALAESVRRACVHYALSVPAALVILCLVPMGLQPTAMSFLAFAVSTAAAALPFYFAGTAVSAVLTRHALPVGRMYGSDLLGASLGCLFVLGGLELLDAPSLLLACAAIGAASAACFRAGTAAGKARGRRPELWIAGALLAASLLNALSPAGIRPLVVKGRKIEPATTYLFERWNSFSRIAVYPRTERSPHYWGPSPLAPQAPTEQYAMNIDGEAGTEVTRFRSRADLEYLRYDVTNVAYHLGREGPACVIGVGGGRDLQSAWLFGHRPVTGVELNPIFVGLLRGEFRDFAGLTGPDFKLVVAEARSHLSHDRSKYAVIQMSLIDTWAATGAGAFSLSENTLYTVEGWDVFLDRLQEDGIFTVSRWHNAARIGETGRLVSLAVSALLRRGVEDPSRHLALVTLGKISTLIVSPRAFTAGDVARLRATSDSLGYEIAGLPGHPAKDPLLAGLLQARSRADLEEVIRDAPLNYAAPTDENPYFFNMLRLSRLRQAFYAPYGVLRGNLSATLTLLGLLAALAVTALATIVLPLLLGARARGARVRARLPWPGMLYFSLIGAGFMLAEIALIQRLTVFLSHPLYALGILLFTLIASTGVGSLVSDRLPLTRRPWPQALAVLAAAGLVGLSFLLTALLARLAVAPMAAKIAVSVGVIFPVGLVLGTFFPAGMRLAREAAADPIQTDVPWYWALNGIFGVLCSALAVLISIYAGVSVNFHLAAACYLLLIVAQAGFGARRK